MKETFSIVIPARFSGPEAYTVLIESMGKSSDRLAQHVQVDASQLRHFDEEGANYLNLIPHFFRSRKCQVSVVLPDDAKTLFALEKANILENLHSSFYIGGRNKASRPSAENTDAFRHHERAIRSILVRDVYESSLSNVGFLREQMKHFFSDPDLSANIGLCFLELVGNIFMHSMEIIGCATINFRWQSPTSGQRSGVNEIVLAVTDMGIGVAESFRRSHLRFTRELTLDEHYLEYALSPFTSSKPGIGGGMGLYTVSRTSDFMTISSGVASVSIGRKTGGKQKIRRIPNLIGTSVITALQENKGESNKMIEQMPEAGAL